MTASLFDDDDSAPFGATTRLGEHAVVLRGWALPHVAALWPALQAVIAQAPFRHMLTPGGQRMQVALTNCGALGWISDRHGYRYGTHDPQTGQPWPAMPAALRALAQSAADRAGFAGFHPDACLVNRYTPGSGTPLTPQTRPRGKAQHRRAFPASALGRVVEHAAARTGIRSPAA